MKLTWIAEMNTTQDVDWIYAAAFNAIEQAFAELGQRENLLKFLNLPVAGAQAIDRVIAPALALDLRKQSSLLWALNKQINSPSLRARIADLLAQGIREKTSLPQSDPSPEGAEFARDGFFGFSDLVSRSEAAEMLEYFRGCANLTRQDTVLQHDVRDIVRAPHAFRIATDPRVLSVASQHIGAPATVVQMDAWWSLPERDEPHGAQIFHRDRDDFRACKLFLYLSDVTSGDGPHIFVRGSHRIDAVQDALNAKGMAQDSLEAFFTGNGRAMAHVVEDVFGPAVMEITGSAGTCFLENTFGFHRGKVPKTGRRCIFQALYAAVPYADRLQRWAEAQLDAVPLDSAHTPLARHAARLAIA